jgi:multidrug efflux pump subunit AcrB
MKNSFSINIIFLLLTIIGLALVSRLPVQLQPHNQGDAVNVSFRWHGMGAEVIEREVTSPIEGTLSALRGVLNISSQSYKDRGQVSLEFKKGTDMDAARFEVASLMRSLHARLPDGVQLPQVSYRGGSGEEDPLLMVYTINGEGSSYSLQDYVSRNVVPRISHLDDISSANVTGATPLEWELTYDKNQLQLYGISVYDLQKAIREHLARKELGQSSIRRDASEETIHLTFSSSASDSLRWEEVVVAKSGNRIVRLTDLATPMLKETEPYSYFRVNGLNTVYLAINSAKGANQMALATEVKTVIDDLKHGFPQNFSMLVNYDASEHIQTEVKKITSRALLAIIILLLFVLLISRMWRYLVIIALSLFANLSIAVIFYYVLGIEIHLYSLAGITVSLGMIIDNTIVMADHLRHSGNRKAFLAILAATLTTMGAMTVIFFLKEEQRLNLMDFAIVMLVNLSVSLAVALFFVPALLDQLPLKASRKKRFIRRNRRVVRTTHRYQRFLHFGIKWRWAFILIFIWGFGFPVFFLPDKIETKEEKESNGFQISDEKEPAWYINLYNKTLGNPDYVGTVKPWVNKILGGSWYYFSNYYSSQNFNWDDSRTRLWARGSMPDGSTIQQMNEVFIGLENFLAGFEEVDMFTSNIYSIDQTSIEISFKPEFENGAFPHQLKNELIRQANTTGSADFSIYGVGQGFSNASYDGMRNNRLQLKGYNYDLLLEQADRMKDTLLMNPRIQEVIVQTGISWRGKPRYEFVMGLDRDKLEETGSSMRNLYANLLFVTPNDLNAGYMPGKDGMVSVTLREAHKNQTSVWSMENSLLASGQASYRLKDVGGLKRERTGNVIRKRNQQYELNVEYDFIGPYELNRRVRERYVEQVREGLPMGFSIHDASGWGGWKKEEKTQYWLLLLVLAVIFVMCAILFESLLQPLAVISAIPVSFIGLFLTFGLFNINFDQGGYAAMILLCGLTVNAALYIINDYNNLKKRSNNQPKMQLFLKAYNHKIIPILLTTLSTIMGLLPFLLAGKEEGFWFSLAAGATGGLIFSLVAVVVWLPLILVRKRG